MQFLLPIIDRSSKICGNICRLLATGQPIRQISLTRMITPMEELIKIGVSACLLGQNVRYNGGHSRDPFITDMLSHFVEFFPVCPEVECGFSVPREALRLVGNPEAPRLITSNTRQDLTERMLSWCSEKLQDLEKLDLCGFIFKKGSPSSGMERVKVYNDNGMPSNRGVGMFARAFMRRFQLLPVEEDGRLHDPGTKGEFHRGDFCIKEMEGVYISKAYSTRSNRIPFQTQASAYVT